MFHIQDETSPGDAVEDKRELLQLFTLPDLLPTDEPTPSSPSPIRRETNGEDPAG